MKHCNLFIYYGAKVNKVDYERLTNALGMDRFYESVFSKGLTFRDIGEVGTSFDYIVGKEICWKMNEPIELQNVNNALSIGNNNIILDSITENDVRQKLLELDITSTPQYYFFYCWDNYEYQQ